MMEAAGEPECLHVACSTGKGTVTSQARRLPAQEAHKGSIRLVATASSCLKKTAAKARLPIQDELTFALLWSGFSLILAKRCTGISVSGMRESKQKQVCDEYD